MSRMSQFPRWFEAEDAAKSVARSMSGAECRGMTLHVIHNELRDSEDAPPFAVTPHFGDSSWIMCLASFANGHEVKS